MSVIHGKRYNALKKRFLTKYPLNTVDQSFDEKAFVHFLSAEVAPNIAPSSLSAYKASCLINMESVAAKEMLRCIKPVLRTSLPKRKTSSMRAKKISNQDMSALVSFAENELEQDKRSNGVFAITWLYVTLLTGLRPHEWLHAELRDKILHVKNVKLQKCVEEKWPDRAIDVSHLDTDYLVCISDLLNLFQKDGRSVDGVARFETFRKQTTAWLRKANKKLFPRRKRSITLLSARHQFIANLKANKAYSPKEIAYMVGHASDWRSFESYGKKSSGLKHVNMPSIPSEVAEDVEMVREHYDERISRILNSPRHHIAGQNELN